jgi:ABC-2 type transport system ATP-binding protein
MRCEIAASLIHDPAILFLDEPTIWLDAVSKLAVRRVIAELNRQRKVTVILTSHDMDDIEALTNRILLIGKGKILYDGPLRKLRERFDRRRRLELSFEAGAGANPGLGTGLGTGAELAARAGAASLPEPEGTCLVSHTGSHAVWEVDTGVVSVSAALRALGETLTITDMSAGSRPIEEIIASLYQEGGLDG